MIRKKRLILLGCLLVIGLISGMALAQDGRINPPASTISAATHCTATMMTAARC